MKLSLEVDCSPNELREFFGMPDMRDINEKMTEAMRERMLKSLDEVDNQKLMSLWMSQFSGIKDSGEKMQQAFWNAFGSANTKK
ncbi:MAG: DUF6489 family protein [Pseudomonadota bacterium]